eukprot:339330_1
MTKTNTVIAEWLSQEEIIERKKVKIALIGNTKAADSQIMKNIFCSYNNYSQFDMNYLKTQIHQQCICQMKLLIQLLDVNIENNIQSPYFLQSKQYLIELRYDSNTKINDKIMNSIQQIWSEPSIKRFYHQIQSKSRYRLKIKRSSHHFWDYIQRISKPNYIPNMCDIFYITVANKDIITDINVSREERFGNYAYSFIYLNDIHLLQRLKVKQQLDCIQLIIYVIDISCYNLCDESKLKQMELLILKFIQNNIIEVGLSNIPQDVIGIILQFASSVIVTNKLKQQIEKFEHFIVKNKYYLRNKSLILFFDKYTVFEKKIWEIPIDIVPEEQNINPNDSNDVVRWIANEFIKCFDGKNVQLLRQRPLRIHKIGPEIDQLQRVFSDIFYDMASLLARPTLI